MRYRAPGAGGLRVVAFDDLAMVYHRASGQTHVVAPPVPEMLDTLGEQVLSAAELLAALQLRYDLPDADAAAVAARLEELAAIGLVERR
ncbi:HPr-rel-A system PqqD family peptide chaperone [Sphingomonas sp. VNH70]|uniref:HPr-rel-A system PqqD family peptide chaperone n=1 Tax=Sphingomonas silueang TaxID=3156617 RepID=UPI0032B43B2E